MLSTDRVYQHVVLPDGETIVYHGEWYGLSRIWRTSIVDGLTTQLAPTLEGGFLRVSPNSEWVAFYSANESFGVVPLWGGDPWVVEMSVGEDLESFNFSRDSSLIAYTRKHYGDSTFQCSLHAVPVQGGDILDIHLSSNTNGQARHWFAISRGFAVFERTKGLVQSVRVVSLATGEINDLTPNAPTGANTSTPLWSPDGKTFTYRGDVRENGSFEVFVYDVGGQYKAGDCTPGTSAQAGANTQLPACTVPDEGEYLLTDCTPGSASTLGTDSTVNSCVGAFAPCTPANGTCVDAQTPTCPHAPGDN